MPEIVSLNNKETLLEHTDMLNEIRKANAKVVAEIGVWKGELAYYILNSDYGKNITEYCAIDSYEDFDSKGGTMVANIRQGRTKEQVKEYWDNLYNQVSDLLKRFKNCRLIRERSVIAAEMFEPEHFDLVFIDANHTYWSAFIDIRKWYPLVKKGGYLYGHDYGAKRYPGVKQAVDELLPQREVLSAKIWKVTKT